MNTDKTKKVIRQGSTKSKDANTRLTVRFKNSDERRAVEEGARNCGYGTAKQSGASSYMKAVVLGYAPKSVFDHSVMIEMCKVHADLGRVGGLIRKCMDEGLVNEPYESHIAELQQIRRELKWLISDIREGKFLAS